MANICRLCLNIVLPPSIVAVYKNRPSLEEQIKYLLPDIDIDLASTVNMCNLCINSLYTAYSFARTCRETEETIKTYISQYNIRPVNLDEVQKFQNIHFPKILQDFPEDIIKIETHDVGIKAEIAKVNVDQQVVDRHQAGCFTCKYNQYEEVLHTKEEYEKHCSSHAVDMASVLNLNLRDVPKPQFENSTVTCDIPQDVIAIQRQNLEMKMEIENVDRTNPSDKYYEHFEDETTEKESEDFSLVSEKLDGVKVEGLNIDINAGNDVDDRKRLNITYICNECHKTFEDKETLDVHQKQCPFYKCDLYEKTLVDTRWKCHSIPETQTNLVSNQTLQEGSRSNARNLELPIKESTVRNLTSQTQFKREINRPYQCQFCSMSFKQKITLTRHIQYKHEIGRPYKCQTCGMSFKQKGILTRHIQYKHEIDRPHKCQSCGMSFKQKCILIRHIQCKHEIDRPYDCQICGMSFKQKGHLTRHIQYKHDKKDQPHKCQICNMSFNQKSHLTPHIKCKHEIERSHKCQTCGMSFRQKGNLTRHIQCKHEVERPYKCQICSMSFTRKSHLTVHIKCKHEVDRPYKCQTCGMSFKQKRTLTIHIQCKHEVDRPYKCQTCDMSFKQKSILRRHIQCKHGIDRPFKCQTCGKSFNQKTNLASHMRSKHEMGPINVQSAINRCH